MGWFPLLVLIVFGMVSIAFMVQMPKEKPRHNIKRVIRGVDVKHPSVEPEEVETIEPKNIAGDTSQHIEHTQELKSLCRPDITKKDLLEWLSIPSKLVSTTPPRLNPITCDNGERIYDVFMFSHELDILEIRLYELWDVVDEFHIIENNFDFHGVSQEPVLFNTDRMTRFNKFKNKMKFHINKASFHESSHVDWSFEEHSTKFAVSIANSLDGIVIFGHVDEIPLRSSVQKLKECDVKLPMNFASWMPIANVKYAFKSDFPATGYPYSIGEPSAAFGKDIHGLARGKFINVIPGGFHATGYCYMPAQLYKTLTATEYTYNALQDDENCVQIYFEECQNTLMGRKRLVHEKDKFRLPWLLEKNQASFASWFGKIDSRISENMDITIQTLDNQNVLTFTPEPGIRKYIAQAGQDKYIDSMLQNKKLSSGRFVEFGGYQGDEYSNSWYFEKFYNWHGIMIEAEKKHIEHLKKVRPNAVIYNNAVCPPGIKEIDFASSKIGGWGGINEHIDDQRWKNSIADVHSVQCVDLNQVLEENNMFQIDYMTVDTEGSEFAILKTFQFQRFNITFIQVERNIKTKKQQKEKQNMIDFMQTKGYTVENIFDIGNSAVDVLFRKNQMPDKHNILITDYEECAKGPKPNWKQVNGFWIDLHPKNIDVHVSGAFYRNSVWENVKFKFLDSLGAKTFVDIGANIGVFTLQALHKGYNVIAVEGADLNIQRLCSSIVKNKFKTIKLYKAVVWDDDIGTLNFESPKENAGGTHVDITNTNTGTPKVLLDTVISGLTNYVMKIDIEAAECKAFKSHFFEHPAKGLTMEWGNLKNNKNLCPQRMYEELVRNISKSYGRNLLHYNGWDAPPLTLKTFGTS